MKTKFLATLLAGAMLLAPAAAKADSSGVWAGADFGPDSYFLYLGGVTALQNQDIRTQDGFLLRGSLGFGNYDYDTPAVPGGNVDSDVFSGDLMVGYGHHFGPHTLSFYAGGEFQNHDPSPNDPGNSVDGTEGGVKAQLELNAHPAENCVLDLAGSYSTAFDSYWSRGFAGYDFGPVTIGPEIGFLGNEEWDQVRFGASAGDVDLGFVNARAYVGYANNDGQGDDGMYGGLAFGKGF
jgi:hypothetical protein